jgi:hypothetical protein
MGQFIEFTDFQDETIVLTNSAYNHINHIIDRHGSIVTKYVKFIAEALQHPYAFGNSKKYPDVKIYVSKLKTLKRKTTRQVI